MAMVQDKVKATEDMCLEGEPPAKVAKTSTEAEAGSDTPAASSKDNRSRQTCTPDPLNEGRMHTEVQALLVGADLTAVTVGQLRARLEQRLGLSAGMLASRKRLRRQVSWVVQQEVMKKNQRNNDCELILKALIEHKECPAAVRQMIIDGLPQAVHLEAGGVPHGHQVRFLGITRDAVLDAQHQVDGELSASESVLSTSEIDRCSSEALRDLARQADEKASVEEEAALVASKSAKADVRKYQADMDQAEATRQTALARMKEVQEEHQIYVALQEGALQTLIDGSWTEEQSRDMAVAAVQSRLKDLPIETALVDAAPVSLARRPADRGIFDKMTLDHMKSVFGEKVAELAKLIPREAHDEAEARCIVQAALLTSAQACSADLASKLECARESALNVAIELQDAKENVRRLVKLEEAQKVARDACVARLQDLVDTVAVVDRLIAPPAEPAAEADMDVDAANELAEGLGSAFTDEANSNAASQPPSVAAAAETASRNSSDHEGEDTKEAAQLSVAAAAEAASRSSSDHEGEETKEAAQLSVAVAGEAAIRSSSDHEGEEKEAARPSVAAAAEAASRSSSDHEGEEEHMMETVEEKVDETSEEKAAEASEEMDETVEAVAEVTPEAPLEVKADDDEKHQVQEEAADVDLPVVANRGDMTVEAPMKSDAAPRVDVEVEDIKMQNVTKEVPDAFPSPSRKRGLMAACSPGSVGRSSWPPPSPLRRGAGIVAVALEGGLLQQVPEV